MLTFKIIPKCFQDASSYAGDDADFHIELDAWDDYTYHVTYHLHATKRITGETNVYLGYIKFMHPGPEGLPVLWEPRCCNTCCHRILSGRQLQGTGR